MSDELSGWGMPAWLPPGVQRRWMAAEAADQREAREAERSRAERLEKLHERAVESFCADAERRGDLVTLQQKISGEGLGRTLGAVLEEARMEADRADAREAARLRIEGHGQPQHIEFFGDPVISHPAVRSETGRRIFSRARRFRELLEARRQLEAAEKAAWASRNDHGLVDGVTVRPRVSSRSATVSRETPEQTYRRACAEIGAPVDGVRFR